MNSRFASMLTVSVVMALFVGPAEPAAAFTTSLGQEWQPEPDAWTRGNDADTAHFGWDNMTNPAAPLLPTLPFPTGARILDDTTPDLDPATTAVGPRFYQGTDGIADPSPTTYGHVSTTGNFYTGFNETDFAHNTIVGTAPASGTGGFTTVVLQLFGSAAANAGLLFDIDDTVVPWTLDKELFALNGAGSGLYWLEWWAPGSELTFDIQFSSDYSSVALDAVQVDTFWSETGPVLNRRHTIPEPATLVLATFGGLVLLVNGRRRAAFDTRNPRKSGR